MKSIFGAAAFLGGLAFGTAANAAPIMYQFSAIEAGISAAGFFTFDSATNQESAISITVSGFPGGFGVYNGVYTQAGPSTPPATTPFFGTPADDIIVGKKGTLQAYVGFAAPLGPSGGTISVFGATSGGLGSSQFIAPTGSVMAIIGVPEPGSFAVLGVGILGLVGLGLQRRRPATPPATLP